MRKQGSVRGPVDLCIQDLGETTGVGEDVGKMNPVTLLVGMQASATTLENNMEAS
jgi:hypothetical protein